MIIFSCRANRTLLADDDYWIFGCCICQYLVVLRERCIGLISLKMHRVSADRSNTFWPLSCNVSDHLCNIGSRHNYFISFLFLECAHVYSHHFHIISDCQKNSKSFTPFKLPPFFNLSLFSRTIFAIIVRLARLLYNWMICLVVVLLVNQIY